MELKAKGLKFSPVIKDPVRYPKVQTRVENQFKENFENSLKVLQVQIVKVLTKNIGK